MDKNFVDIDNLVRQRLGGGEAQEPSGSWHNMRELLDKEMPQQHGGSGGFFGRRMFGAVALLIVVGAATIGSYKYATDPNNATDNNAELAVASPAQGSSSVPADGKVAGEAPAPVAGMPVTTAANSTSVNSDNHATAGNEAGVTDNTVANPNAGVNTTPANTIAKTATAGNANNVPANNSRPGNNVANNNSNRNGSSPAIVATADSNANDRTQNTRTANVPVKTADKERNGSQAGVAKTTNTTNNRTATGTSNVRTTGTDKMVVSSSAPASNGVPVFVTKTGKRIPGDKLQKLNIDKTKQNNTNVNSESSNALKGKRVIQRMRLIERFIKATPSGEGFYKMDTISVVTLTEELGIITETKVSVPKPASSDSKK